MKKIIAGKVAAFSLILITIFALAFAACAQKQKITVKKINSLHKTFVKFESDEFQIFTLVNVERDKLGLNQLLWDEEVAEIARNYSERMAKENFFSHFDADGYSVLDRAKAARLKHWSKVGENLFSVVNLDKFDAFTVKNWMESSAHRENILNSEWTTTGIGIARSPEGEFFITQVFIKR